MKKKRVVLTALIAGLFFISNAKAKCGSEELAKINDEASKVKVTYNIEKKTIANPYEPNDAGEKPDTIEVEYIKVSIMNLTDNVSVRLTNSKDKSVRTFTSKDATDGVATYEISDTSAIAKLDYVVYTTLNTNCANEEVLKNETTLPMKNPNYENGACNLNPDAPECQKYITKEITPEDFEKFTEKETEKKVKEIKEEEEKKNKDNKSFVEKNKMAIIIGGSIIIVSGVVTTAVVIKKRRSRLI